MEVKTRKKERWEIEELVFDKNSLMTLARMIKKGFFEKIDYPISTGKEANVFRAKAKRGFVVVKIHKIETTLFKKRKGYIFSDPRFRIKKLDERRLIYLFASKEFKNLNIAKSIGIKCPTPLTHEKNIVVMKFLGRNGLPFPKLSEAYNLVEDKEELLNSILRDIKKMHRNGFVHGDLSEYNILFDPNKQKHYIIDFGQGTIKGNPNYNEFLERDLKNIVSFFSKKMGIKLNKELINEIKEQD